jgi:hypothetical protein
MQMVALFLFCFGSNNLLLLFGLNPALKFIIQNFL